MIRNSVRFLVYKAHRSRFAGTRGGRPVVSRTCAVKILAVRRPDTQCTVTDACRTNNQSEKQVHMCRCSEWSTWSLFQPYTHLDISDLSFCLDQVGLALNGVVHLGLLNLPMQKNMCREWWVFWVFGSVKDEFKCFPRAHTRRVYTIFDNEWDHFPFLRNG
jgi:hypothetical protein